MAEEKDIWDKLRIGTTAAGAVLIPLVVGIVGWQVNTAVKERDAQVRMIELAVGILQQEPDPEAGIGLREWAVDVIDRHSGVALSQAAQLELLQRSLPEISYFPYPGSEKFKAIIEEMQRRSDEAHKTIQQYEGTQSGK